MITWYRSKTILVNLAIVGLAYLFRWSSFYVDPVWFVWGIAAVNIALRTVTARPVAWRSEP